MMSVDEFDQFAENIGRHNQWVMSDMQALSNHIWIAKATTTHLSAQGEPEESFLIIGEYTTYVTLDFDALPALGVWIDQQRGQGE